MLSMRRENKLVVLPAPKPVADRFSLRGPQKAPARSHSVPLPDSKSASTSGGEEKEQEKAEAEPGRWLISSGQPVPCDVIPDAGYVAVVDPVTMVRSAVVDASC